MNLIILFVIVATLQQPAIVNGPPKKVGASWTSEGKYQVRVRRSNVLADSYKLISNLKNPVSYLKKLELLFVNEGGLDSGGPKKEWITILSRRLFNPKLGLFMYSKATNNKVQINPCSGDRKPNHLSLFRFAGIITGLAINYNFQLVVSFALPFLKSILSKSIELEDIKEADPPLYSALKTVLKEDPKKLGFTFTVQDTKNGRSITRYLPPYKKKVPVTNKNKQEYVRIMLKWKFTTRIRPQMDAFKDGLYEFIPLNSLRRFSEHRLHLKISGIQVINVKDWKANTVYLGSCGIDHHTVKLFWRMVENWSNVDRARLLQFATGSSIVPGGGFKALTGEENKPFQFHLYVDLQENLDFVPAGNTCVNRIDMPAYTSLSVMERKFKVALSQSHFTFS